MLENSFYLLHFYLKKEVMKLFVLFCLVLLISADSGRGSWVDNDDEDCQRAAGV